MYISTPKSIHYKRAIINVKSEDNKSFLYSILAHKYKKKYQRNQVSSYKQYLHELRLGDIKLPIKLQDITTFEDLNDVKINIYCVDEDANFPISLIRMCKNITPSCTPINLLLIIGKKNNHFTYICKFNRLFSSATKQRWVCPYCLKGFTKTDYSKCLLEKHIPECYTKINNHFQMASYIIPECYTKLFIKNFH